MSISFQKSAGTSRQSSAILRSHLFFLKDERQASVLETGATAIENHIDDIAEADLYFAFDRQFFSCLAW